MCNGFFTVDCGLFSGNFVGVFFGYFTYVGYIFNPLFVVSVVCGDGGYIDIVEGMEVFYVRVVMELCVVVVAGCMNCCTDAVMCFEV